MTNRYLRKLLDIAAEYGNAYENESILITGASGLVGGALLEVFVLMQKEFNVSLQLNVLVRNAKSVPVSMYYSVIEGDTKTVDLSSYNFSYVFHAAGISSPNLYMKKPVDTIETNIVGTSNLLTYVSKMNIRRFLFVSTGEVYGHLDNVEYIDENMVGLLDFGATRSSYSESKRATENLVSAYGIQYGVPVNIARLSHVLGPYFAKTDQRISAEFFRLAWHNQSIVLKSTGETIRTYIFITDVVSGFLHMAMYGDSGEIFNVTNSENSISIREFAEHVSHINHVGVEFKVPSSFEIKSSAPMKVATFDDSKLKSIGWKPTTSILEAISIVNERGIQENRIDI